MDTAVLINEVLKDYSTSSAVAADWQLGSLQQLLHAWVGRFSAAFGLDIATPALLIDRLRGRATGSYLGQRNGLGLPHQIALNTKSLEDASLAEQLLALLREVLHEWQSLHGKPGRWNYHNREFRDKASCLGVEFDEAGRLKRVAPGRFMELLQRHEVDTAPLACAQALRAKRQGHSKMKKWSCRCKNVRSAVPVCFRCEECGELLQCTESTLQGKQERHPAILV